MEMDKDSNKKHFILVHGACHGAWCWYKLAALLEKAGHKATAVDLAGCGNHPKQLEEVRSIHDYAQPLMEEMAVLPSDEKVVLVGHSYGGLVISLAMEAFPEKVSAAVFATAFMPVPDLPGLEIFGELFRRTSLSPGFFMDSMFGFDKGPENAPTTVLFGTECLASKMYQNCPAEDFKLATMLIRPSKFFTEELEDTSMFTEEKFGCVSRVYIVCRDDKVIEEDFQRWNISCQKASGCEVMEIEGSDHMVMMSKPHQLLDCLLVVAKNHV